jgi:hypothetical protein
MEYSGTLNLKSETMITTVAEAENKLQLTMTVKEQKLAVNPVKDQTTLCQSSKG